MYIKTRVFENVPTFSALSPHPLHLLLKRSTTNYHCFTLWRMLGKCGECGKLWITRGKLETQSVGNAGRFSKYNPYILYDYIDLSLELFMDCLLFKNKDDRYYMFNSYIYLELLMNSLKNKSIEKNNMPAICLYRGAEKHRYIAMASVNCHWRV